MADRVRFHLDEHMDPAIASGLRRHGVDVTTTVEAALRMRTDEEHLEYGRTSGRVVVTHDPDFLRLAKQVPEHAGIAFCHQTALSVGEIIRALILIYEVLTPSEMWNRVEFLS